MFSTSWRWRNEEGYAGSRRKRALLDYVDEEYVDDFPVEFQDNKKSNKNSYDEVGFPLMGLNMSAL